MGVRVPGEQHEEKGPLPVWAQAHLPCLLVDEQRSSQLPGCSPLLRVLKTKIGCHEFKDKISDLNRPQRLGVVAEIKRQKEESNTLRGDVLLQSVWWWGGGGRVCRLGVACCLDSQLCWLTDNVMLRPACYQMHYVTYKDKDRKLTLGLYYKDNNRHEFNL